MRAIKFGAVICTLLCLLLGGVVVFIYDGNNELGLTIGWIACGFGVAAVIFGLTTQLLRWKKR